jgi:hypothetical protein
VHLSGGHDAPFSDAGWEATSAAADGVRRFARERCDVDLVASTTAFNVS